MSFLVTVCVSLWSGLRSISHFTEQLGPIAVVVLCLLLASLESRDIVWPLQMKFWSLTTLTCPFSKKFSIKFFFFSFNSFGLLFSPRGIEKCWDTARFYFKVMYTENSFYQYNTSLCVSINLQAARFLSRSCDVMIIESLMDPDGWQGSIKALDSSSFDSKNTYNFHTYIFMTTGDENN